MSITVAVAMKQVHVLLITMSDKQQWNQNRTTSGPAQSNDMDDNHIGKPVNEPLQ